MSSRSMIDKADNLSSTSNTFSSDDGLFDDMDQEI